jgi:hypothetical protein
MVMKHRLIFLAPLLGFFLSALGQDTTHQVTLSREKLLAFEGVFTGPNPDQSVRFTADNNSLKAKLLWADATLTLYPSSDTEFFSKGEEPVHIRFTKRPDGVVDQLLLNNVATWRRNPNYHPFVFVEAKHTADELKPYEGIFAMNGNYVRLFEKDNELIMKYYSNGEERTYIPDSSWNFYIPQNLAFRLQFVRDANGQITQFIQFKQDHWEKTKPAHYSAADLKAFEGKYHLDVDSDDVVQVTAVGPALVIKQLWDGKSMTLSPEADLFFYNSAASFSLGFVKAGDGKITEAIGPNNNRFVKMP